MWLQWRAGGQGGHGAPRASRLPTVRMLAVLWLSWEQAAEGERREQT